MSNHFLLLISLLFLLGCKGQEQAKSSTDSNPSNALDLLKKSHPQLDPQIASYVVEVFEDSKGNLWFGTMSKGAARFDGKTLTYLTTNDGLIGNTVTSFEEDDLGNIWLSTHSGLSKYNGKTFTNYTINEGLIHHRLSDLLIDKTGTLWVGTWGGVSKFDGSTFTDFPLPTPEITPPAYQETANWVTEIMEDRQGNIWFGRSGYGACKYDGTTFTQYTTEDGLPSNCVQAILEGNEGDIWFGTRVAEKDAPNPTERTGRGGLSRYNGKTFEQFPDQEGLSKNDVYSLYKDKKGAIWIGAIGLGVYWFNGKTFRLYKGTDRMDLTNHMGIQDILEDKNGNFWFGLSGGLFRLSDTSIINVTKEGPWE